MLMRKFNFHYFPRDIDSGDLVENFLVSAIASILVIRLFLQITGFPILGGENFHIAHMLWGGFLMMVAVIGLLVFLNKETKYIASILGGIGFGTFIDELGKFITKDNNYFYQPTIGIIYVVFVLLFLGARVIEKYFRPNKQEYAINALDMTKQIIMHDLDVHEKERALYFLKQSDPDNPVVKMLTEALREVKTRSVAKKNLFHKIRDYVKTRYVSLIHYPKFIKLIITFFVIISVVNVLNALFNFSAAQTFSEWGQLIFSLFSGILVLAGVYILRYHRSRRNAYELFKYAILVSILLTQFFRFLEQELSAIFGLLLNLVILSVLQYLIYQESLLTKKERVEVSLPAE